MDAAAEHYLREKVSTATPAQLTGMLFDAAVSWTRTAVARLEADDLAEARRLLLRTQDVVFELRSTLNPAAGDISRNLDSLYEWTLRRLMAAGSDGGPAAAREALEVLEPLQGAWRTACLRRAA